MISLPVFVVVLSCVFLLGLGGGVGLQRRRAGRQGRAALASLDQLAQTLSGLELSLAEQREQTNVARDQRDAEARKAQEYFTRIEGIVREADECRRLLVRTGAEHGNAQAMMLGEIESLTHQYAMLARQYRDATGKAPSRPEPRLNRAIQLVASEFREAHVAPYQGVPVAQDADGGTAPGLDRGTAKA